MVSFEIFVKAMPPSLLELKVLLCFCFAFKIPDDVAVTNTYLSDNILHCRVINIKAHRLYHAYVKMNAVIFFHLKIEPEIIAMSCVKIVETAGTYLKSNISRSKVLRHHFYLPKVMNDTVPK